MATTNNITEKFYGVAIWDLTNPDSPYYTEVDVSQTLNRNFKTIVQETINSKYPYVIHPSKADYLSGTAKGNFADNQTDECNIDWDNITFKLAFGDFLANKRTKYLKLADNLIIPVAITAIGYEIENVINDGITTSISFDWVQVGDIRSNTDNHIMCTVCNQTLIPNANYCHGCGNPVEPIDIETT